MSESTRARVRIKLSIVFDSMRMEPVFMILGQFAATVTIDGDTSVQG